MTTNFKSDGRLYKKKQDSDQLEESGKINQLVKIHKNNGLIKKAKESLFSVYLIIVTTIVDCSLKLMEKLKEIKREKNGEKYKRLSEEYKSWNEIENRKFNQKMEKKKLLKENEILEQKIAKNMKGISTVKEYFKGLVEYSQNQDRVQKEANEEVKRLEKQAQKQNLLENKMKIEKEKFKELEREKQEKNTRQKEKIKEQEALNKEGEKKFQVFEKHSNSRRANLEISTKEVTEGEEKQKQLEIEKKRNK
jgi:hypothetical protein